MSNITLTIPNDDHIALRAFGKALEEMALAHGAEPVQLETYCNVTMNDEQNDQLRRKLKNVLGEPRDGDIDVTRAMVEQCAPIIDTTAQQVESLSAPMGNVESDEEQAPSTSDSTGTPWDERIHSTSKALNADGTWRLRRKPKDMDEAEWAALVESVRVELDLRQGMPVEEQVIMEEAVANDKFNVLKIQEACTVEPPVTPPANALYAPENYVHMYRAADNIYALAKSDAEVADFEADGYVRHTQEQYDVWEGPNTADEGDDFHTDASVVAEQTVAGIPPIPVPPPVALPGSTGATDLLPPAPIPTAVPTLVDWTFPKLMTFLTERQGKIDVATVNMLLAQDGIASLPELNAHPDKIGPFVARVKAHLGE